MSDKETQAHISRVKALPCGICGQAGPSDAHHILEGRVPSRRCHDWLTVPLCKDCHQGSRNGIHGQRFMWLASKKNELDVLGETLQSLYGSTK